MPSSRPITTPTLVKSLEGLDIVQVAVGDVHSLVLTSTAPRHHEQNSCSVLIDIQAMANSTAAARTVMGSLA